VVESLSLNQATTLYEAFESRLSLRGFTRIIGQPYWRLRDYRRQAERRAALAKKHEDLIEQVKVAAFEEPTYG
jgi:hypothetical protein